MMSRGLSRAIILLLATAGSICHAATTSSALAGALRGTHASAVVLDQQSGATLASVGDSRRTAPGSVIKPLLLSYALAHGIVRPETEVYCHRHLIVDGRSLPCTHPADQTVFTASSALAESCNTWFAELGRRYSGPQLEAALNATGLNHKSVEQASLETRELTVLGLQGVTVTPIELARAYRELLRSMSASGTIAQGLEGSVKYGMANAASVDGIKILGKTGTASDSGETWTHGWFAGALSDRYIVVIYVPRGDGGQAATLANRFFSALLAKGKRQ